MLHGSLIQRHVM